METVYMETVYLRTAQHDIDFSVNPPVLVPAKDPAGKDLVLYTGPFYKPLALAWIEFRHQESPNTTTRWSIIDKEAIPANVLVNTNILDDHQLSAAVALVEKEKEGK